MALIPCPHCGKEISSYAKRCPSCGMELVLQSNDSICCPECGNQYSKDMKACPTCGEPNKKISQEKAETTSEDISMNDSALKIVINCCSCGAPISVESQEQYEVICPYCGGLNIMENDEENNLEEKIIPIHGDAMDMPFAKDYFDAIVSVDSYHYFACKKGVFAEKILPFVKKNGYVMIAIPGLKEEPKGSLKEIFCEYIINYKNEELLINESSFNLLYLDIYVY